MKKLKLFLVKFILFVYIKYIYDTDLEYLTIVGKFCLYPTWFLKSIVLWIISPIFIPEYFYVNSALYKEVQKIQNSPEFQAEIAKMINLMNF